MNYWNGSLLSDEEHYADEEVADEEEEDFE